MTVGKWRKRSTVEDLKTGPKAPHSTTLTEAEEAMAVAFRRHTLLPLDDCLYALQPSIPHLTHSALHRCLQRHGISRLPDIEGDKPKRQRFKRYPIGFFHIDIAEVQTAAGKLYLFVAIGRTSKFAVTQLVDKADRRTAWKFLEHLLQAVPYRIHTILTEKPLHHQPDPPDAGTKHLGNLTGKWQIPPHIVIEFPGRICVAADFPVDYPAGRKFAVESGSQQTASTATPAQLARFVPTSPRKQGVSVAKPHPTAKKGGGSASCPRSPL
jgi:hypothetical protein